MSDIDGADLLRDLMAFVGMYVVVDADQCAAIALWIVHTHTFDAAEATPYLSVTSAEKQSGKTRLLEVLDLVVKEPWLAVSPTPAVVYREIEAKRPTLLLDESDTTFKGDKERAQALIGLLNAGHRKGLTVPLCVGKGEKIETRRFKVFCAKAIAGIGSLPDTVSDRSIPIRLQRKNKDEVVNRLHRRKVEPAAAELRECASKWAAAHIQKLEHADPAPLDEISDRAFDCWEPLLAIADVIGGEWPKKARKAAVCLHTGATAEDQSIGVRLLADIQRVFDATEGTATDRLPSADLVAGLNGIEESDWAEFSRGKPLTANTLSRLLRCYTVKPHQVRFGDKTLKGYERDQFTDLWARYHSHTPPTDRNMGNNLDSIGPCDPISERNELETLNETALNRNSDEPKRFDFVSPLFRSENDLEATIHGDVSDVSVQKGGMHGEAPL